MSEIFQKSVIQKHLTNLDNEKVSNAFEKFKNYFHNKAIQENIKNSKEEQFQAKFLDELFVNIFNYVLNPKENYNITTEFKNQTDAKKADGAILKDGKAIAVIELKSTKTKNLENIKEQAFNYKNNQPDCKYVITSNFSKLRFYIDNAIEFEEFDLFKLTEERFRELYLILEKDQLFSEIPQILKEETKFHEENISGQFYKDYSAFKTKVFENLVKNNPQYDKLLLFKKSQKFLDRLLFVFFAEDTGLVPPNAISKIIEQWKQLQDLEAYQPLYDRFKLFFTHLNEGHKYKAYELPPYNGGLFALDNVLYNVKIDDEILKDDSLKLSAYDFSTDVDVNILGHIFEHSLNEIEEITSEIEGKTTDKSKTKRKKDGVFYTPKYITQYIVENTIGTLCKEKKEELEIRNIDVDETFRKVDGKITAKGKTLYQTLNEYKEWMLTLKILDPACGSGAFLNQALNFLIAEHKSIDEFISEITGDALGLFDTDKAILENNLFGVDINEESVEIAKLSLWLRTARKGRQLSILSNNIKCGNSLIDDPEVAGDKAFDWNKEFPQIFHIKKKKSHHITWVTHNSRTSQRMINNKIKTGEAVWLEENEEIEITRIIASIIKEDKLNVVEYNICGDHIHMLLVCEDNEVSNIVRKLKGKSSQKYKEFLQIPKEEKFTLWAQKYSNTYIKDDENLYAVIKYIRNNRKKHELTINNGLQPIVNEMTCKLEHAFRTEYNGGFDVVIGNPPYVNFSNLPKEQRAYFKKNSNVCKNKTDLYAFFIEQSEKIIKQNGKLSFIFPHTWVSTTSFTPLRKLFFENFNINGLVELGHGVFQDAVVKTVIIVCTKGEGFIGIPIYNGEFKLKLKIPKEVVLNDDELLINFDWNPEKQAIENKIFNESIRLDSILRFTRGIKTSNDKRFLHFEKKNEEFKKVIRGRNIKAYRIDFEGEFVWYRPDLMKEKVGCLPHTKELFEVKEKLITQRVNSSGELLVTYDDNQFYCLDTTNVSVIEKKLDIDLKYLLVILNSSLINWWFNDKFKMPTISGYELHQIPIKIKKSIEKRMIELGNLKLDQNPKFRAVLKKFMNHIQSKFDLEKLSQKLQKWHELEFKEFLIELKKAKIKLSLSEESEWIEYFKEQKEKAQILKAEIEKTDKEIDQMVYELYGLTEEEIEIVEDNA